MRVIAGVYKGRRLRAVEGRQVRPTSDRLRETLFNILAPSIEGVRFLDVCAGSGAVGIEALSRGASHATLIERSRKACSAIAANLASLGITGEATVINCEAYAALLRLAEAGARFDIVFVDPPYEAGLYSAIMKLLGTADLVEKNGIVVVEHRAKLPPEPEFGSLRSYREVKQGESALAFYTRV